MKTTTEQKSITERNQIIPEQGREGLITNHPEPHAFQDKPKRFREALQISVIPMHINGWHHGGLNE